MTKTKSPTGRIIPVEIRNPGHGQGRRARELKRAFASDRVFHAPEIDYGTLETRVAAATGLKIALGDAGAWRDKRRKAEEEP